MAALPYMQLYVADYLADTMHLSAEEHGAYLLLIFNYWQTGKSLPDNDKRLANVARLSNERWTDVKQTLIEYFVLVDGKLIHPRIEADLEYINIKQKKASDAGKASAVARRQKKDAKMKAKSTDVPTDVPTDAIDTCKHVGNHSDSDSDSDSDTKLKSNVDKKININEQIKLKPKFIKDDLWVSFVSARKERKAVQSLRAVNMSIIELEKIHNSGADVNSAIETFLVNPWKSLKIDYLSNNNVAITGQSSQARRNVK